MGRQTRTPIIMLTTALVALGIVAGIQPDAENGAVLLFALPVAYLLVFLSTWVLLATVLPTPGFRLPSQREGLVGGILIFLPLVVGFINVCVGSAESSPLFVPLLMLNAVAVSATCWFMTFCIAHLLTQDRPLLFKVIGFVLLILGSLVAMPVYWYVFVWRPCIGLRLYRNLTIGTGEKLKRLDESLTRAPEMRLPTLPSTDVPAPAVRPTQAD
jgi:hypothetical protein